MNSKNVRFNYIFQQGTLTYYTRVFQSAEKEHSSYETNQSTLSNSTPKPNHFKLSNSPHLQQPPICPPPKPLPILKSKIAFTVTTNHSIF